MIKVCGITHDEDLISISRMGVDYAGFIFVDSSPRYVEGKLSEELPCLLSRSVPALKKTGVFLDETEDTIREKMERYCLDAVQLHGAEPPEQCGVFYGEKTVFKSFAIGIPEDFEITAAYEGCCNYFLFDASGPFAGGNGVQFDWDLLDEYQGSTPFFLSGGIGPADLPKLAEIRHPLFAGIDINSRFEIYPGKKDVQRLATFIPAFKSLRYELPRR